MKRLWRQKQISRKLGSAEWCSLLQKGLQHVSRSLQAVATLREITSVLIGLSDPELLKRYTRILCAGELTL